MLQLTERAATAPECPDYGDPPMVFTLSIMAIGTLVNTVIAQLNLHTKKENGEIRKNFSRF